MQHCAYLIIEPQRLAPVYFKSKPGKQRERTKSECQGSQGTSTDSEFPNPSQIRAELVRRS